MYRVFLGAPPKEIPDTDNISYSWQTISSKASSLSASGVIPDDGSVTLPAATLEAASARISILYQNVIFHDDSHDDITGSGSGSISTSNPSNNTTVFMWPPTPAEGEPVRNERSRAGDVTGIPSFLLNDSSTMESFQGKNSILSQQAEEGQARQSMLSGLKQQPSLQSPSGSQRSQSQLQSQSYSHLNSHSRQSIDPFSQSIARFPSFQFNPNVLCSLAQLTKAPKRVSMLLAVLEVDGPDVVKIKTGPDAGREVGVLKMILGEEGGVGKLTAWREIAERWGGVSGEGVAVKRGDVVLIENVNGLRDAATAPSLTASPYLNSKLTICYRTMPYTKEDQALRPDLRLGASDAAVRKVGGVVRWFEKMARLA